jgi:hypothetical protein
VSYIAGHGSDSQNGISILLLVHPLGILDDIFFINKSMPRIYDLNRYSKDQI